MPLPITCTDYTMFSFAACLDACSCSYSEILRLKLIRKVTPLSRSYCSRWDGDHWPARRWSAARSAARGQRRSVIYLFTCMAHGVVILFPVSAHQHRGQCARRGPVDPQTRIHRQDRTCDPLVQHYKPERSYLGRVVESAFDGV